MELSDKLKKDAVAMGLCEDHERAWVIRDRFNFVEYYKTNPNWCLERKYPDYECLMDNFNQSMTQRQGVFVGQEDMNFTLDDPQGRPVYIFNNCSGTIIVDEWNVSRVYVALGSKLKFIVKDNAILILDYYDDAKLEIEAGKGSKVTIYQYGSSPVKSIGGTIRLRKKNGRNETL